MKSKSHSFSGILITVLFSILPICLSLSLMFLFRNATWLSISLFVLAVMVTFSTSVYCALYMYRERLFSIYIKQIRKSVFQGRYKTLTTEGCGNIPMIQRADLVAEYERKGEFSEIWLVSSDLDTEVNDGVYAGTVIHNLNRGIHYTYFVPKSDINSVRILRLKTESKNVENLKFYYLPDNFFFLSPDFDLAIYEPSKGRSDGRLSYMGLQVPESEHLFEVQMNDRLTDTVIQKLKEIMEHSTPV